MSVNALLRNIRVQYVYLSKPRNYKDSPRFNYSVQVICPKDSDNLKELQDRINDVKAAAKLDENDYVVDFLRDGDNPREGKVTDITKGNFIFNANSLSDITKAEDITPENLAADEGKVTTLDEFGQPCDPAKIYSGCYTHLQIAVYYQKEHKKVCAALNGVMFSEAGPRLDGKVAATEFFAGLAKKADPAAVFTDPSEAEEDSEDEEDFDT